MYVCVYIYIYIYVYDYKIIHIHTLFLSGAPRSAPPKTSRGRSPVGILYYNIIQYNIS